MSKQIKLSVIIFIGFLFLFFGFTPLTSIGTSFTHISYKTPLHLSLIPHDHIVIKSDNNFTDYGFPGLGTAEDPYIIENYNITTIENNGISITGITKYFIICNCYLDANANGIRIYKVPYGLTTITNNTCNNNGCGITLYSSDNCIVTDNTCCNNSYGISLTGSESCILANNNCTDNLNRGIYVDYSSRYCNFYHNICNNNSFCGIFVWESSSCTLTDNICTNNYYGIFVWESPFCTLTDNICNNNHVGIELYEMYYCYSPLTKNVCNGNEYGIFLFYTSRVTLTDNTCSNNNDTGISLWESSSCTLTCNVLQENIEYGIYIGFISSYNVIHHNTFIDNNVGGTSQAKDDGDNNVWFDQSINEGNYWSDWSGSGIYLIDGFAVAADPYPPSEPVITELSHIVSFSFFLLLFSVIIIIYSSKIRRKTEIY